ncbi:Proteinase-activated receptor 1 [Sarcoptes scabiei]|uniref:Proteinase-activated receptor 1 n=1 Tax=Sarcoptes scabiei TaxID=52283 RepID=A0A834V9S8_SARSC|nr:Proteinase-activated receptor 1 [Sarcoptes scabiei]
MSSIAEQTMLWKAYQHHQSILNDCANFLNNNNSSNNTINSFSISSTPSSSTWLPDHLLNNTDNILNSSINGSSIVSSVETSSSTSTSASTSSSIAFNPCDPKLISDIGSMIIQLGRLINSNESIYFGNQETRHPQLQQQQQFDLQNEFAINFGLDFGPLSEYNGINVNIENNPISNRSLLSSSPSSSMIDSRADQFFIKYPHDMLHPTINPSFMPIIITHTITFLIGVIGNGVVIATWSMHGKFRSPTAVFLVSLAIADLFLLLVFVPLETLEYFMITWGGMSSICKMIAYVEAISAMSTVMNLVAVSIERFLVIVYPMRARSWCTVSSTRKGLLIIWSIAFVFSTPILLTRHTSQITYYNSTTSLTLYYCLDVENDLTLIVAIYQLLVMFIFPALFMVVCYYVVIRQLWNSTRSVNQMTQAENQSNNQSMFVISTTSMMNRKSLSSYRQEDDDYVVDDDDDDGTDSKRNYHTHHNEINHRRFSLNRRRSSELSNHHQPRQKFSFSRQYSQILQEQPIILHNERTASITTSTKQTAATMSSISRQMKSKRKKPKKQFWWQRKKLSDFDDNLPEPKTKIIDDFDLEADNDDKVGVEIDFDRNKLRSLREDIEKNLLDSFESKQSESKRINGNKSDGSSNFNRRQSTSSSSKNTNGIEKMNDEDGTDYETILINQNPRRKSLLLKQLASTESIESNQTNRINTLSRRSLVPIAEKSNNHHRVTLNPLQQQQQSKSKPLLRRFSSDNSDHQQIPATNRIVRYSSNRASQCSFTSNHTAHQHLHKPCSRTLLTNVMEITKSRIQVIKMLMLIITLFLLCWGPRLIMNVLVKSGLSTYSSWIYNLRVMCNLLSFIHSALNPFVYGFMSSNFRQMVFVLFRRCRGETGMDLKKIRQRQLRQQHSNIIH